MARSRLSIDNGRAQALIIDFIKEKAADYSVLIGLSGGLDSAITCALAVKALGLDRVKALIIKNIRYSEESLIGARQFARELGIEIIEIDTDAMRVAAIIQTGVNESEETKIASLDARITDLILRTMADQLDSLYLGTINGTERLTGWYPKGALFGDYCPVGGLLKSQVQSLAQYLGLPESIVNSVSSDASRICSGCGELPEFRGIPYDVLDTVLASYESLADHSIQAISGDSGINLPTVETILSRIKRVAHKQHVFCRFSDLKGE